MLAERLPEVTAHESVQMGPAMIARADLVLTATRQHRSAVVTTLPAAIGRTFTILQFVVQAKLARSLVQPVPGEEDDLPDPMGKGVQEFRLCADRLQNSVDRILRPLTLLDQR